MNQKTLVRSTDLAARLRPSILRLGRTISKESRLTKNSILDIQILQTIREQPDSTVTDLAAAEQITRASMAQHIHRLVQLGYVQRADAKTYKPGSPVELRLTRTGRQYLNGVSKRRSDWLVQRLEILTEDDFRSLHQAMKPLQRILAS